MTLPVLRPHFPQDNGCFVHLLFTLVHPAIMKPFVFGKTPWLIGIVNVVSVHIHRRPCFYFSRHPSFGWLNKDYGWVMQVKPLWIARLHQKMRLNCSLKVTRSRATIVNPTSSNSRPYLCLSWNCLDSLNLTGKWVWQRHSDKTLWCDKNWTEVEWVECF